MVTLTFGPREADNDAEERASAYERNFTVRLSKDLIVIDLESTAGDHTIGCICEIGTIYACKEDLTILSEFSSLVKPLTDYRDRKAMMVHQILEESLQKADELGVVLENFELWIKNVLHSDNLKKIMLASWGIFDVLLLQNQYKAINRVYPFLYTTFDIKSVVCWELGKMGKSIQYGTLKKVSNILDIPFIGISHRAINDARQALRILQYLAVK